MPFSEFKQKRVFVGEILVERPYTYTGYFCDLGGGAIQPVGNEYARRRFKNGFNRFLGATLSRFLANRLSDIFYGHGSAILANRGGPHRLTANERTR